MEEWNRGLMKKAEQLQDKLGNGWIIFEEDNRFVVRRDRTYFIISPVGVDFVTQSIGRTEFESILRMLSRSSE